jgi:hypothetical protein
MEQLSTALMEWCKYLSFCVLLFSLQKRKVDSFIQATLRMGAAQMLFLDTPSHAAVKETVDLLRMDPQMKVP